MPQYARRTRSVRAIAMIRKMGRAAAADSRGSDGLFVTGPIHAAHFHSKLPKFHSRLPKFHSRLPKFHSIFGVQAFSGAPRPNAPTA